MHAARSDRRIRPKSFDMKLLKLLQSRGSANSVQSAQEAYLRDHPVEVAYPASHFEAASAALESVGLNPDPADGYRYGSAWRVEEVPAEIIAELRELPDADRAPAWV